MRVTLIILLTVSHRVAALRPRTSVSLASEEFLKSHECLLAAQEILTNFGVNFTIKGLLGTGRGAPPRLRFPTDCQPDGLVCNLDGKLTMDCVGGGCFADQKKCKGWTSVCYSPDRARSLGVDQQGFLDGTEESEKAMKELMENNPGGVPECSPPPKIESTLDDGGNSTPVDDGDGIDTTSQRRQLDAVGNDGERRLAPSPNDLKLLFPYLDIDGSSRLEATEILWLVKIIMQKETPSSNLLLANPYGYQTFVHKTVRTVDVDGDGVLSRLEYTQFIQRVVSRRVHFFIPIATSSNVSTP